MKQNTIKGITLILFVLLMLSCESVKNLYNSTQVSKVFTLVNRTGDSNIFDDKKIKIEFSVNKRQLDFTLTNLTNKLLKVDWDASSLIFENVSKRVIHSGVKYIDRNSPQLPTTITSNSKLLDHVLPADNIVLKQHAFDPKNIGAPSISWEVSNMISISDKTFKFYLYLISQDKPLEYTFVFEKTNK